MSVFISPVGGVGAQFLDNNGSPLSGGKLYTYIAATTTPQATYTSYTGLVSHTNPIILDSAGRIPSNGEVWLSDNAVYKFVLKTSADVSLASWDQLAGINDIGVLASLSVLSSNLGVVSIASGGDLHSGKTSSGDTTAGFFLGNESGVPKVSIGDASESLAWDGASLNISGAVIQTANMVADSISNSATIQTGALTAIPDPAATTMTGNYADVVALAGVLAGSTISVNQHMRLWSTCNNTSINQFWWNLKLKEGATTLVESEGWAVAAQLGTWRYFDITIPLVYMTTNATVGAHSYTIEWSVAPTDTSGGAQTFNAGAQVVANASIAAMELKR